MPPLAKGSTTRLDSLKRTFQAAGALLCLAAVLLASGVHTVALQGYAWVRMYDAYSQSVPTRTALELTFSGDELCGICVISQDTLDDVSDSLELTLGEQKPLVHASFAIEWQPSEQTVPLTHGFSPLRTLREISLAFDPPPPRSA